MFIYKSIFEFNSFVIYVLQIKASQFVFMSNDKIPRSIFSYRAVHYLFGQVSDHSTDWRYSSIGQSINLLNEGGFLGVDEFLPMYKVCFLSRGGLPFPSPAQGTFDNTISFCGAQYIRPILNS